jgi:hypothetical protein
MKKIIIILFAILSLFLIPFISSATSSIALYTIGFLSIGGIFIYKRRMKKEESEDE